MSRTNKKNVQTNENYPTPATVVDRLIDHMDISIYDSFLEPCRGNRVIYDKVPVIDPNKSWCEISEGKDYLTTQFKNKFDLIITNPPFSLSEQFIKKSLSELTDNGTLVYLLRLNFLGSLKRLDFWFEVGFPTNLITIVPRPKFINNKSDACEYAWFIWDYGDRLKNLNSIDVIN